ncbi:MAG: relaxase domain-containing protein [Saprospiraceae bacterium]|nr:relaxase domain-containing protein [Saprospiraceae bacterium]
MLRIIVNSSAAGAKKYYSEGLSKQDYYSEKQEIVGKWGGKAAEKLGLKGEVTQEEFSNLCDNINPQTGEQLTARQNENRRVGYDINFHAPKSLSLLYSQTQDKDILENFRASVHETMSEMEKDMQTRVRANGAMDNRDTSNFAYAEFIHTTSRPVNGEPDPHLHAHCFTFNATYDDVEQKWKAGEFGQIKTDGAYYEAFFHSQLTDKLSQSGYQIERTEGGWEIAGVNRSTIEKFSNRTAEIERIADEKGITDAKAKDQLGATTRENKRKGLDNSELKDLWQNRLTDAEKAWVAGAKNPAVAGEKKKEIEPDKVANKAVDLALEHSFERKSVASERELLTLAMKQSYGSANPEQVKNALVQKDNLITRKSDKPSDKTTFVTTQQALKEETKLIKSVTEDRGKFKPINPKYEIENDLLNHEQRKAINHALTSKDRTIVIEGGAGTGKTTLMKELAKGIEKADKKIFGFAPSADASRGVLREEGFHSADTVAHFLKNKDLQAQVKNQVIWIDEAGQLGNKTMNSVMDIAKTQNARLILSGDIRQHGAVERGDALRIIQERTGTKTARVNEIQRQKPQDYKQAVKLLSEGRMTEGYDKLHKMGAVHEMESTVERHKAIAQDYYKAVEEKKSALVVAPTHKEGEEVTKAIRTQLKDKQRLGAIDKTFTTYKNLSFTDAQKKDHTLFKEGHVVQFHQNVKGFKAGDRYEFTQKDKLSHIGSVMVRDKEGKEKLLDLNHAPNFQVFDKVETALSQGDKIRITQNGKSLENRKLNNGQVYSVVGFNKKNDILLSNGTTLGKDFAHFTHGYCTTSHASQGKSVDRVLIAQSSASFKATSKQQFYVSVSRGKQSCTVYTDNVADLRQAINKNADRLTASDIADKNTKIDKTDKTQEQQKLVSRLKSLKDSYTSRGDVGRGQGKSGFGGKGK